MALHCHAKQALLVFANNNVTDNLLISKYTWISSWRSNILHREGTIKTIWRPLAQKIPIEEHKTGKTKWSQAQGTRKSKSHSVAFSSFPGCRPLLQASHPGHPKSSSSPLTWVCPLGATPPYSSKGGPQKGIARECLRYAGPRAPLQNYWIRIWY